MDNVGLRAVIQYLGFTGLSLNSLPKDKFLDWFKLKAFGDSKIEFCFGKGRVLGRVENIMRKGEIAGYQHFLLFPQCF